MFSKIFQRELSGNHKHNPKGILTIAWDELDENLDNIQKIRKTFEPRKFYLTDYTSEQEFRRYFDPSNREQNFDRGMQLFINRIGSALEVGDELVVDCVEHRKQFYIWCGTDYILDFEDRSGEFRWDNMQMSSKYLNSTSSQYASH